MIGMMNMPTAGSLQMPQRMPQQNQGMGRFESLMANPLLHIGMGLLSAGQDGNINPYQAAMQGMMNAQQYRDHYDDKRTKKQKEEAEKNLAKMLMNADGMTPQQLAGALAQAGDNRGAASILARMMIQGQGDTAQIRNHEYRNSLSPEEREVWDRQTGRQENIPVSLQVDREIQARLDAGDVKGARRLADIHRAGSRVDLGGGGVGFVNPVMGMNPDVAVTPEDATERDAARSGALAMEGILKTDQAQAQVALPLAREQLRRQLKTITDVRDHESRELGTGKSSILPNIPGTGLSDFRAKLKQLQGQTFISGFDALRGSGAVTEVEGLKAEMALQNLEDAQTEEQFLKALNDLEGVFTRSLGVLEERAAGAPVAKPTASGVNTEEGFIPIDDLVKKYAKP